jgi:hypothetical protein
MPRATLAWYQKLPPGPVYLCAFAGVGLTMLLMLLRLPERSAWTPYVLFAARLGRSSLFAFVLQYWVYHSFLFGLHLPYTAWWPLLFVGSTVFVWAVTGIWEAVYSHRPVAPPWRWRPSAAH